MSLFGSLFKIAGGFLTGGPAGVVAAGASLLLHKSPGAGISAADSVITTERDVGGGLYRSKTSKYYFDGGGPVGGTDNIPSPGRPGQLLPPMAAGACPAGFRLNKSTYVTRGGGTSRWPMQLQVHPKQSTCVKRRRRNVGNARALRRAISRVKGFVKLARKAHSLVGGHRGKTKRIGPGQNIEIVRG